MSGGKVVAWLIEWSGRRVAHLHNAIGDYRDFDPNATSEPLVLQSDLAAAIARAEAWKQAFTIERQRLYISQGMKIEQARIHAENDAAIAAQQAEGEDRG